ncbi:von Hippel-Lindau disease tumor suppressor-like [Bombus fervidus]|uniref:von Hippel-Lindau disease tumor suppressor-like n=1 Tax=Bombus fervidus TaxID=203811 RepID=UPI003AB70D8A
MEESQEQQQPLLRSINNVYLSLVRFVNKTMHNVVLYWIDYQGQAISYGVLFPGEHADINTFVTHPWIFVDEETKDRYTVNQKDVFFPEPSRLSIIRQGHQHPMTVAWRRCQRTDVYITLPVYTLREMCLRAIKRLLTHCGQAFQLDIPRILQHELAIMLLEDEESDNTQNS